MAPDAGKNYISKNTPKTPISRDFRNKKLSDYDTKRTNYDTISLRLYKVNQIFYYRRRINYKLVRISLRTKDIREALKRKKLLDMLEDSDLFQFKKGDYELIFEYDTHEELKEMLEITQHKEALKLLNKFDNVQQLQKTIPANITFMDLKDLFILDLKQRDKQNNFDEYNSTFNLLFSHFNTKPIQSITKQDFKAFREYLKDDKRSNTTINKHMRYLKTFIKFAHENDYISHDNVSHIKPLDTKKENDKRSEKARNFSDSEINQIFEFDYGDDIYNKIFKILAYSGMRSGELWALQQKDILEEDGIWIFNNRGTKTDNAKRKIPIHKDILNMVLNMKFPIDKSSKNAFEKRLRERLYRVVEKGSGVVVHTLRATFIQKCLETNIDKANVGLLTQDIVGHSKSQTDQLTWERYGKFEALKSKQEIINSVKY